MTIKASLEYELIPFLLSLFSNKDQKMNKAGFSKTSLKELTDPLDPTNQPCCTLVIDGGWLLCMVRRNNIRPGRRLPTVTRAMCNVRATTPRRSTVVFDGYSRSPNDHDHTWRTKNSCCDLQIRTGYGPLDPKSKVLGQHSQQE